MVKCAGAQGKGKWNQSTAPLARNDLAEIRALGFNVVRLAVGWASLEPEPGKVDGCGPPRGDEAAFAFPIRNPVCMGLLYGRAGRLTAQTVDFRPGQTPRR